MKAVTVDTTAGGVLVAAAGNRDFLHMFNNGSQTVYIKYDGDATALTTTNGWPIPAGTFFNLDNDGHRNLFNKDVYAIVASGSADLRVEGGGS